MSTESPLRKVPTALLVGALALFYVGARLVFEIASIALVAAEQRFSSDSWANVSGHATLALPYVLAAVATGWLCRALLAGRSRSGPVVLAAVCGLVYLNLAGRLAMTGGDWVLVLAIAAGIGVTVLALGSRGFLESAGRGVARGFQWLRRVGT